MLHKKGRISAESEVEMVNRLNIIAEISKNYRGVGEVFGRFWKNYGGISAVLLSPYFHAAIIFTGALYPIWIAPGWHEIVKTVMPSMVSFSLGGFAIWLALGDQHFRSIICGCEDENEQSIYMAVNSSFLHFIILQILSILVAIFAESWLPDKAPMTLAANAFSFLGFLVFSYALLSGVASAMAIYRVASWYDNAMTIMKRRQANTISSD
ncbi:MAG: hypothetical protein HQL99_15360 [Magnetococcales bacterium]|nr:hypothetical protein [Magnetococcales bacterium]